MPPISRAMRRVKEIATCEFCGERVVYNRLNIGEIKSKGRHPVLICVTCYGQGAHLQQGYRKI